MPLPELSLEFLKGRDSAAFNAGTPSLNAFNRFEFVGVVVLTGDLEFVRINVPEIRTNGFTSVPKMKPAKLRST